MTPRVTYEFQDRVPGQVAGLKQSWQEQNVSDALRRLLEEHHGNEIAFLHPHEPGRMRVWRRHVLPTPCEAQLHTRSNPLETVLGRVCVLPLSHRNHGSFHQDESGFVWQETP